MTDTGIQRETEPRAISAQDVQSALELVVFKGNPFTIEAPQPACSWEVCTKDGGKNCHFPRYSRNGEPVGLTAKILIQLGYPHQLLLDLDREHELGDILHPGVKIGRSANNALKRIRPAGIALLTFIQDHQQSGKSWGAIRLKALGPCWRPRPLDSKKRPWLYE